MSRPAGRRGAVAGARPRAAVGRRWGSRCGRLAGALRVLTVCLSLAGLSLGGRAKSATLEGKPIPADRVAGIVAGRTTEAEIREWFGPPADVVVTNAGKVLTYQYRKGSAGLLSLPLLGIGGGTASGQMLIVTLDDRGRVVRHTFIGGPFQ